MLDFFLDFTAAATLFLGTQAAILETAASRATITLLQCRQK